MPETFNAIALLTPAGHLAIPLNILRVPAPEEHPAARERTT
jgi:hypothetical protein